MDDPSNSTHSQKKHISLYTAEEVARIDDINNDGNGEYDDIKINKCVTILV